jgi:hypothetical protein
VSGQFHLPRVGLFARPASTGLLPGDKGLWEFVEFTKKKREEKTVFSWIRVCASAKQTAGGEARSTGEGDGRAEAEVDARGGGCAPPRRAQARRRQVAHHPEGPRV